MIYQVARFNYVFILEIQLNIDLIKDAIPVPYVKLQFDFKNKKQNSLEIANRPLQI